MERERERERESERERQTDGERERERMVRYNERKQYIDSVLYLSISNPPSLLSQFPFHGWDRK